MRREFSFIVGVLSAIASCSNATGKTPEAQTGRTAEAGATGTAGRFESGGARAEMHADAAVPSSSSDAGSRPIVTAAQGGQTAAGTAVSSGGAGSPGSGGQAAPAVAGGGGMRATEPAADGDGCPLQLEGFATLEGGTTGGGHTEPSYVTTQAELRACATAAEPRVCLVRGAIKFNPFEEINVQSDKSILGEGDSAHIVMGGFRLNAGVHNVIFRNLTIRDSFIEGQYEEGGDDGGDRDGIQMDTADHVWIDHVHFHHLGDGMIDSRKDTTYLTVSWNVLENHNKAFGIGWTDNVTSQITIHHNWIHDTTQRNPSADNVLRAHLFNNLLEDVSSYGNYARGKTNMVLQNSVFVRVKDPHYYDEGTLIASGNVYRDVSGMREDMGSSFSFFDPSKFYEYTLDTAREAESLVKRCAGPRKHLVQASIVTEK